MDQHGNSGREESCGTPLLVRHLPEISAAKVAIVFDGDHQIIVEGSLASVVEKLRKFMW
ncbi:MAG: hypothetical protein ACLQB4_21805 [Beijerinckiaceae bacterium]